MVARGPFRSIQLAPAVVAKPKTEIATTKRGASNLGVQSSGVVAVTPTMRVSGSLKTDKAYTCPIHRWTASTAGGISQRLKSGGATACSLAKIFIAAPVS